MDREEKLIVTGGLIFVLVVVFVIFKPFYVVDPGETAIHMRMGRIKAVHSEAGCYYKTPFIDSVLLWDTRIRKVVIETHALSKDLQTIDIGVALNYNVNKAAEVFARIGSKVEQVIINPYGQETIKATIAAFTAEELIQKRHQVTVMIVEQLKQRLAQFDINLIDVNVTHADFDKDFIEAVEQKQIAEQLAKQAKNLTERVREEAAQTQLKADAEAYKMKVMKQSITNEFIELKKIEKWDGHLPNVMTGSTPFIDIGSSYAEASADKCG